MSFDIVIPVGPNDFDIVVDSVEYAKKNVIGYRNIYIVSSKNYEISGCIHVPESQFPFSIDSITEKIEYRQRAGWYLQQLIKITAGQYIPDLLENYLVLDADVFVVKPTTFMEDGLPLFAYGSEYHYPYFYHMVRLHPSLLRQTNMSGICHHMMYTKTYLNKLFALVEDYTKKSFADAFMDAVTERGPSASGASEYEIYFNYMILNHPDKMKIRQIPWSNLDSLSQYNGIDNFVAVHYYLRK